MFSRADGLRFRQAAFLLLMLSINVIDSIATRSGANPDCRMLVAIGATFDVIVLVSALYYWMLVRPGIRTPGSLVPIALIGVLHATHFYSNAIAVRVALPGYARLD